MCGYKEVGSINVHIRRKPSTFLPYAFTINLRFQNNFGLISNYLNF